MEFKTAEEKLLHDYSALEDENARLEYDNEVLRKRIEGYERRLEEAGEQARRLEIERDHHADCVKDMLATAAFYGFEQPTRITYNPETQTMQPADDEPDGKCIVYTAENEGLE